MTLYHTLHVLALGLWGGLVATEAVLEIQGRRHAELHGPATRMHYAIDLFVELPFLVLVVASGVALLLALPPVGPLHGLKIAGGLAAVAANGVCIALVILRHRALARPTPDPAAYARYTRWIFACFIAGVPIAALAAGLGFYLAGLRAG